MKILDNVRYGHIDELKRIITHTDLLIEVLSAGFEVKYEAVMYNTTINDAVVFIHTHRSKGHIVSVGDEYGRRHDQCHEDVSCKSCGHYWSCQLTEKHDGECSPKSAPTDGLTKSS